MLYTCAFILFTFLLLNFSLKCSNKSQNNVLGNKQKLYTLEPKFTNLAHKRKNISRISVSVLLMRDLFSLVCMRIDKELSMPYESQHLTGKILRVMFLQ